MMLYEEGHFLLEDPVSKFIPEFKDPKVLVPDESDPNSYIYSGDQSKSRR